jgi:release factor H-coupled RctB family protein
MHVPRKLQGGLETLPEISRIQTGTGLWGRSLLIDFMPTGEQEKNLLSFAHGAGRKWNRSECEGRLRERFSADSLRKTKLGSYVICEDKGLLYEEAPQAYKDIEVIIGDMVSFGLIRVIASFTPLMTYEVRER